MPSQILTDQIFETPIQSGKETYSLILGTQEPDSIVTRCTVNAKGGGWGLKMPGNTGSRFYGCYFTGGKERALDVVQGGNLRFEDCAFAHGPERKPVKTRWSLRKTCDIGIKGGAFDIRFDRCTMTDLLLGDHSIYDNPGIGAKTRGIVLTNCVHPGGRDVPIIIRAYNADLPQLVYTNAVALKWCGPVVIVYFWVAGKWIDSRIQPK